MSRSQPAADNPHDPQPQSPLMTNHVSDGVEKNRSTTRSPSRRPSEPLSTRLSPPPGDSRDSSSDSPSGEAAEMGSLSSLCSNNQKAQDQSLIQAQGAAAGQVHRNKVCITIACLFVTVVGFIGILLAVYKKSVTTKKESSECRNWCDSPYTVPHEELNLWEMDYVDDALSRYRNATYIHQISLILGEHEVTIRGQDVFDCFVILRAGYDLYHTYVWSTRNKYNQTKFTFYKCNRVGIGGVEYWDAARKIRDLIFPSRCTPGDGGGQRDPDVKTPNSSLSIRFKIFVDVFLDHVVLRSSVNGSSPKLDGNYTFDADETIQDYVPILVMYQFRERSRIETLTSFPTVALSCSLLRMSSSVAIPQCYDSHDGDKTAKNCSKQSR